MANVGLLAALRRELRNALMEARRHYLNKVWGMDIAPGCAISFSAKLDKTNPKGMSIGKDSAVVFGASILSHDTVRRLHITTRIGERCNIGAHALIMPGVTIGDGSIVGRRPAMSSSATCCRRDASCSAIPRARARNRHRH